MPTNDELQAAREVVERTRKAKQIVKRIEEYFTIVRERQNVITS